MNVLVFTLLRIGFLVALWVLVLAIVVTLRRDVYGIRVKRRRGAAHGSGHGGAVAYGAGAYGAGAGAGAGAGWGAPAGAAAPAAASHANPNSGRAGRRSAKRTALSRI